MLQRTGLAAGEESVYRALLRVPAASCADLAEQLRITPAEATGLLSALERMGMAGAVPGVPGRFRATPPDLAFGPLLHNRELELHEIRSAIATLTDEYRSQDTHRGELVELAIGSAAVAQRFDQLRRSANKEIRGLVKKPTITTALSFHDVHDDEHPTLPTGVRFRTVYDRELLATPDDPTLIQRSVACGEEAKIALDLPITLTIADDALALVPMSHPRPGGEPSAMVVHRSDLLDALIALFETLWASSTPVPVGGNDQTNGNDSTAPLRDNDLRLLSLLLAGLTDQSIGTQLGLSTRTVQRRLHDLIKLTGVRTRVQLIWQATRRGWI